MSLLDALLRKSKAEEMRGVKDPRSKNFDPQLASMNEVGFMGGAGPTDGQWTVRHPGSWWLNFDQLDQMYRQPILQDPPRIRLNQVIDFCTPTDTPWKQGFRVRLRDEGKSMSKATQIKARKISEVIQRGPGRFQMPPQPGDSGNLDNTVAAWLLDSLVYDNAGFEILRNRDPETNGVYGWLPVPGKYLRLARPPRKAWTTRQDFPDDGPEFVQIDANGNVVQSFTRDELAFFIRNPRTDPRWLGYGWPEFDQLWQTCMTMTEAFTWNAANFKNGMNARNIVLLKSQNELSPAMTQTIIRKMMTLLTKARNAQHTAIFPMGVGDDIEVKNLDTNARDMEFSNWLNFNLKLYYGGHLMDPAEGGFLYGPEGQTAALSSKGPEDRITASRERGLRPLLRKVAAIWSAGIVQQCDPDFCVEFCGFGLPSESERLEMDIKSMGFKTANEVRDAHDLPRIDNEVADIPLNPQFVNAYLQKATQGDAEGEGMAPDEDGIMVPGSPQLDDVDTTAPLDEVLKGTDWNNTDEWTQRLVGALKGRVKVENRGAGVRVVVADVGG